MLNTTTGLPGIESVTNLSFGEINAFTEKMRQENRKAAAVIMDSDSKISTEYALEILTKNKQLLNGLYEDALKEATGEKTTYKWDFDNMNVTLSQSDIENLTGAKGTNSFMEKIQGLSKIQGITTDKVIYKIIDILFANKTTGQVCVAFPYGIGLAQQ